MNSPVIEFHEPTHTYSVNGRPVPSVTQVLKEAGLIDTTWYNEWGKHRGSTVHRCMQLLAEDRLDLASVDPRIQGYVDAGARFMDEINFEVERTEMHVCNEKLRFAGTLDLFGRRKNNPAIIDYKTGPLQRPTQIQLTGYSNTDQMPGGPIELWGVQLRIDGTYKMERFIPNFPVWHAALRVVGWKREK